MKKNPLGRFDVDRFLRVVWQKKALVLRGCASQLADALGRADLIDLACRDDVDSRLVAGSGRNWTLRHGPFRRRDFANLPRRNWTLLVNGIETLVPAARALQTDFGFIPYARQDDVMVSYAAPGGGVGPHFDSYDVFLLQGAGTRRWQIGRQSDLALIDGAPIKVLRRFRPQRDLLMHSGDLLYLPPAYVHHGTAIDECLTWSIGMRAPQQREVAARFLDYLQDRLTDGAVYRDTRPQLQTNPAAISAEMRDGLRKMIAALRWRDADIDRCIGEMLSEPRRQAVFKQPRAISEAAFARACRIRGLRLDLKTRMLFDRRTVYINGESAALRATAAREIRQLADRRALDADARPGRAALALFYRWYRAGYVGLGNAARRRPAVGAEKNG